MKDKGGKRPMKGSSASSDRNVDSYMISPSAFFKYLCRPTDPANLAVLRIAFGKYSYGARALYQGR